MEQPILVLLNGFDVLISYQLPKVLDWSDEPVSGATDEKTQLSHYLDM